MVPARLTREDAERVVVFLEECARGFASSRLSSGPGEVAASLNRVCPLLREAIRKGATEEWRFKMAIDVATLSCRKR